jgi:hypothetical protein
MEGGGNDTSPSGATMAVAEVLRRLTLGYLRSALLDIVNFVLVVSESSLLTK